MTREEVEVWVNPSAWDDPDEAARVIEEILSSGSTDEAEWVRIAGGRDEDIAAADERAWGAVEELIHRELGAFAELPLTVSAEEIVAAIAVAMEDIDVNEIIGECAAARPSVASRRRCSTRRRGGAT